MEIPNIKTGRLVFTADDKKLLKDFLVKDCHLSKRLMTKLKQSDRGIMVNGVHTRVIDMVYAGDVVELNICNDQYEKCLEPNPMLYVPKIYETDGFVVYDKPTGMPVHPSIRHQGDTLGNCFAAEYPDIKFRPVNRLDRDTSGLCTVAKNQYCAAALQNNIEKIYYAVVQGKITGRGTIDLPIAREHDSIIKRVVRSDGQKSVTHYEAIDGNDKFTLLKIKLETGRTHQIRVHLSYMGYPLAGDDLYGGDTAYIKNQALHCGKLIIKNPLTSEVTEIVSEMREDMKILI